jgi:hypothetical protein
MSLSMSPAATSSSKRPAPVVYYQVVYTCQGVPVRAVVTNLTAAFLTGFDDDRALDEA